MKKSDYTGLFIWGTGVKAKELNIIYENELKREAIIGYIDNNLKKKGKLFCGKKIYAPDVLKGYKNAAIFISVEKKEEIYQQICTEYPFYKKRILEADYFIKMKLMTRYKKNEDDEVKEILNYLEEHPLNVFNYSFVEKYKAESIFISLENGLYYTIHNGKKLFFSKDYDTEQKAREYYLSLIIEQDINSPHRYLTESFQVPNAAIVIDAGAAEGIFSLDIIDKVKRIYMFEPEKSWVEALNYTFKMYKDKVTIINKCVSNYKDDETTTLDDSIEEGKIDFIKMDIEGEEYYALQGAEKLLTSSPNVKCDICTYHQEFAYAAIKSELEKLGFYIAHSKGYMWYIEHFNIMRPPVLRRGLIRAEKKEHRR
jgi:hypothetical protein